MKISVKNIFLALGASALMASCGENAWNDHLDGFEGGVNYGNPVEGEFTMSAADYNAVASNATNKALAADAGLDKALKAVGSNGMFSAEIPAKQYLPAFLASSSAPYFVAPEGSKVNVTYQETGVTAPVIAEVAAAAKYTVSKADYQSVWSSEVDYIDGFAPMASAEVKLPNVLKNAFPEAAAGEMAIVSYNESSVNPIFISDSDQEEFTGGVVYLVADGSCAAGPIVPNKGYGYLPLTDATVANGIATSDEANAFMFIPTDKGYVIMDAYGRYLYQSGTYNSFNVSATLPASGAYWTVEVAANGQATITNTEVGKWIQYDGAYSSWGSYDSAKGSLPVLYKAPAPKLYLVTAEGNGAGPIVAEKSYGYLASVDMTVENGIVTNGDTANAFTFEHASGAGFYIKDSFGRYLYQTGTYNSFNVAADLPESGALWTLIPNENGAFTIKNTETEKWIQYDSAYTSWGSYNTEKGALPKLYNAAAKATQATRSVAGTPVFTGKTAVYQFDGSKWAPAAGVTALEAADYTAMGFAVNKLEDPAVYLPLYLKQAMPYAVAGDQMAVVYNGAACSVLVFDGQNWTVNNDNLQTLTAQFQLKGGAWQYVKMVGKAYFRETSDLVLNAQYLLVAENICATPLGSSATYGYLPKTDVSIVGGVIEQKNEVNAYTFATTVTTDDAVYKAPEGNFFILDSLGRFVIMQGTYNSFNLSAAPKVTDGVIDAGYLWHAESDGAGAWYIRNVMNEKWIQYSAKYSSFGCYDTDQAEAFRPVLYILSE